MPDTVTTSVGVTLSGVVRRSMEAETFVGATPVTCTGPSKRERKFTPAYKQLVGQGWKVTDAGLFVVIGTRTLLKSPPHR